MMRKERITFASDLLRFGLAGAANTLLTIALYQLFLFAFTSTTSYALTWALGMLFVVLVYLTRVFPGGRTDIATVAVVLTVYLAGFGLGFGAIAWLERMRVSSRGSIFLALAVSTAFNFVLMRIVVRRPARP